MVVDVLAEASRLAAAGRYTEAIEQAVCATRTSRVDELDFRIRDWRHQAFMAARAGVSASPATVSPEPGPALDGLPEIHAHELTPAALTDAMDRHGCLLVRGLGALARLEPLVPMIDRVFEAAEALKQAGPSAWYAPFPLPPGSEKLALGRAWCVKEGVAWMADSPRMLSEMIDFYQELGLIELIGAHLGERPAMSLAKSSLRRTGPQGSSGWHQDGAFLGSDVRTVNCWMALTPCGEDAPGVEIVARRFRHVVRTALDGKGWSVEDHMAEEVARGTRMVSPVFEPGDALLFDHLCLHRTAVRPGMTKTRWALECWFFAPSTYPMEQVPFLI